MLQVPVQQALLKLSVFTNEASCIKYLPSGTGSIHSLPRSLGMLSACASLWACFSSLLSLANALWVMAARCKEPSGFCVRRVTWQVHGLIQNEDLGNFKLCPPLKRNFHVCVVWDYSNSKRKAKQYRKPQRKVTRVKSKFSLILG